MPAKKPKEAAPARIVNVATAKICTDQLVQPRLHLNPGVVDEYRDLMASGVEFPPVDVVLVDDRYLLVDGYLRFEAAKLANRKTLRCEVRRGDLRMALLRSAAANARHGLRRTREDKRRAVDRLLTDAEWSKWSDREIARRCSVSHEFVGQLRSDLTVNVDSDRRKFVCRHGSEAVMNITFIGGKKALSSNVITIDGPPSSEVLPLVEITAQPPETSGEVLDLSDFVEASRARFVDGLQQLETIARELSAITAMRGDPVADAGLARRLIAASESLAWMARRLRGE